MKPPPARIARFADSIRNQVLKATRSVVPPQIALMEMIHSAWNSQALYAGAKLGIPDVLADGPKSAQQVSVEIGADTDGVARLMRHLATMGLFAILDDGRFRLTSMGHAMRADTPGSMRDMALWVGAPEHREHWSQLPYSVQTGKTAVQHIRGEGLFDYFNRNQPLSETFNGAMTSVSSLANEPVLAAYDFRPFATVADIGGGHGSFLAGILEKTPSARGILFDLPDVVKGNVLAEHGVADRCTVVGGSFFESVPSGADAYILRIVIHDWADDEAVAILRSVRAAIKPTGRLLLAEVVLPDRVTSQHPGTLLDLEMLVSVGGRERTRADYAALYAKAGFELTRVVPTATPLAIVEGRPV
jgi:hypothetical protein